jgi:8-oxo-dGTP pyrophosphatase MutT (NUDIX family)
MASNTRGENCEVVSMRSSSPERGCDSRIGQIPTGLKLFVRFSSGLPGRGTRYSETVDDERDDDRDDRSDRDDMRGAVRRSVVERVPIDDDERQRIESFLTEFDRLDDPFSQEHDPVHVTGSAIITGPRGVILLRHKHLGLWLQPGGHVDPGETPWEAALREAHEETGLDLAFARFDDSGMPTLVHVDVHPAGRGHTHLDLRYLVEGDDADPDPPVDESQEIEWLDWDAAIERAGDGRLAAALRSLRPT